MLQFSPIMLRLQRSLHSSFKANCYLLKPPSENHHMRGKKVLGMRVQYTDHFDSLVFLFFVALNWSYWSNSSFLILYSEETEGLCFFFNQLAFFFIILLILLVEKIDLGGNYFFGFSSGCNKNVGSHSPGRESPHTASGSLLPQP